jgi:UDP-N-acetylglucosamine acyltransferase
MIHPTAIVEAGAVVHASSRVGPYALIEAGAEIGPDCLIEGHCRVYGLTRLGRGNIVRHGATLGSTPQDLSYHPDKAKPLTIGDFNQFRECVNVSHGLKTDLGTRIGSHNYLMAFSHVGHDCQLGDHNLLANGATLAGHVELDHHVFLSGQVAVHQFCRIGAFAMVAGVSGVPQDVPPYVTADGHRAHIVGLNTVGLRRNGFTLAQRRLIKAVYRLLFRSGLPLHVALDRAGAEFPAPETEVILAFIRASQRGVIRFAREAGQD